MKQLARLVSMLTFLSLAACSAEPSDGSPCADFCEERCAHDECKNECSAQVCEDGQVGSSSQALTRRPVSVGGGGGLAATDEYPFTCPQWCFDQCHEVGTPITDAVAKCFETCKTEICKGKI